MIKSITFPSATSEENPMWLPSSSSNGTITVFCGPNGSGKSYILRAINEIVGNSRAAARHREAGWIIEYDESKKNIAYRAQSHKTQMHSLGVITKSQIIKKPQHNDDTLLLKLDIFKRILTNSDILTDAKILDKSAPVTKWFTSETLRGELFDYIPSNEKKIYWIDTNKDKVLHHFEQLVLGKLGLRKLANSIELVLRYESGVEASYNTWSAGQKSIFSIIFTVSETRPSLYILDEIENFFHPFYISKALEYLKTHVRQTIIASHHPHLIFGRAVDSVYYVESMPSRRSDKASEYLKHIHQPNPRRHITKLEAGHQKLASAYRLFDIRDSVLLATGSYVIDSVNNFANYIVFQTFDCIPVKAGKSIYLDRQSEEIANVIKGISDVSKKRVFDWGAGLARTSIELSKNADLNQQIKWFLYEAISPEKTYNNVTQIPNIECEVIESRSELGNVSAEVSLLTNVVHSLNPSLLAQAVIDCWNSVNKNNGVILITEIYPLPSPEKNAVPIPHDVLFDFLDSLGFKSFYQYFSVNGAQSYCMVISDHPDNLAEENVYDAAVKMWDNLRRYFMKIYRGSASFEGYLSRTQLLNAAFGLATIDLWFDEHGFQHTIENG